MSETLTYELVNGLRSKISLLENQIELKSMYISQLESVGNKFNDSAPNGGTVVITELRSANVEIERLNKIIEDLKREVENLNDVIGGLEDRIREFEHSQHLS